MKRGLLLLVFAAVCLCSYANDGFRVFTDEQGRAIMLKVVKCDLKHNSVTVEREDGRRLTVKLDAFSKSDQDYVSDWYKANELIDERNLKIEVDKEVVGRREEEIEGTITYMSSGIQETEKAGEMQFEDIAYTITFYNKSAFPIQNAMLEYKIYYEQSSRGLKNPEQEIFSQESKLSDVLPGKKVNFTTESVEILNERFSGSYNYVGSGNPAEGEVHGIRGRLIVTVSEDKTVEREFSYPRGLSEKKYPWNK